MVVGRQPLFFEREGRPVVSKEVEPGSVTLDVMSSLPTWVPTVTIMIQVSCVYGERSEEPVLRQDTPSPSSHLVNRRLIHLLEGTGGDGVSYRYPDRLNQGLQLKSVLG